MPRWSLLMGAPRRGEAPGLRPRGTSAHEATASARRAAALGGAAMLGTLVLALRHWPTPLLGWTSFALAVALAPVLVGMRVRAVGLALRATGRRPTLRLHLESLARPAEPDLASRPEWRRVGAGASQRWLEGLALPGALLLDLAASLPLRVASRDRLRYDASLDTLAASLLAEGAAVERKGHALIVRAHEDAGPVKLRTRRLLFPVGARVLDARGKPDDLRLVRKLLEGPLGHAGAAAWSEAGARLERRVDALARDARLASTLEERGRVLEEIDRFSRTLHDRDLPEEDAALLSHKEATLRARLATRMLSEPPGARLDGRVLSPAPAMLPPLGSVLARGGLDAVRKVVFVPYWIVPVRTRFGETEVAVSAATGKPELAESRALLDAMRRRGPALLLEVGPDAHFLPAPPATAALARDLRALLPPGASLQGEVAGRVDLVYVPYLSTPEGFVCAVTGRISPDLGAPAPVAQAIA